MSTVEVNGAALGYDDRGAGPPVVLLHAGIADRRMWRHQVPALAAAGYRAIALDLRGYGESTLPADPFAHHDDVAGALDALDLAGATLVGCSFGGRVAIDTALAHPARVRGLALFAPALSGHRFSAAFDELWQRFVGDADEDDLAAVAEAEVRMWVVGPDRRPDDVDAALCEFAAELDRGALAAEARLDAIETRELDPPAAQRLAELGMPTLVAVGAADVPEFRELADRIAAEASGARRLPDVPDAAHLLPLERPEATNRALLDFLATITN